MERDKKRKGVSPALAKGAKTHSGKDKVRRPVKYYVAYTCGELGEFINGEIIEVSGAIKTEADMAALTRHIRGSGHWNTYATILWWKQLKG